MEVLVKNILVTFAISMTLVFCLRQIRKTNLKLKKYFVVFSGKSDTGAQLLGGLAISIAMTFGITTFSISSPSWHVNNYILGAFLLSSFIIIFYGYFDDRFELRPIVKLAAQFLAVFTFSAINSIVLGDVLSTIMFVGLMFYGLGTLNGTNLLDGLDMMTVKISSVVFLSFAAIGVMYNSNTVLNYSLAFFAGLLPFTFYNKYPSKMHLGEIGGTYIGMCYMFLFTACFKDLRYSMSFVDSFVVSILPLTISMGEVGISFLRRLYNGKSPFIGDRFHLHHISRNYYKVSVPLTTYLLSFTYGTILFSTLTLMYFTSIPKTILYVSTCVTIGVFQYSYGKKYWMKRKGQKFNLKNIMTSLRKEELVVIDSSKVDAFEFLRVSESKKVASLSEYRKSKDDKDVA